METKQNNTIRQSATAKFKTEGKMKYERIGNIAVFINGFAFKPENWTETGKDIIRIQNLTDNSKPYNKTKLEVDKKYLVKKGDVLISWSATIDIFVWDKEDALLNQHIFKVVFDKTKVDKAYFISAIKQSIKELGKYAHGATMKHVVKGDFENHKIPLPPLPEQIRIAETLSKAEELISERKQSIKLLDDYLKSVFLDMFGDPVKNEKGWEKIKITNTGNILTGTTPSSEKSGMFNGNIPFVTPGDLESDKPVKRYVTEEGAQNSRTVRKGSTFVCCIGATIGKVKRAYSYSAFNQQINAIEWNNGFNDIFGESMMKFYKPVIVSQGSSSTTLPILNKSNFEKIKVIKPPIELQNKFAKIVEKTEQIKSDYKQSLQELENLYGSLSKEAFGE